MPDSDPESRIANVIVTDETIPQVGVQFGQEIIIFVTEEAIVELDPSAQSIWTLPANGIEGIESAGMAVPQRQISSALEAPKHLAGPGAVGGSVKSREQCVAN